MSRRRSGTAAPMTQPEVAPAVEDRQLHRVLTDATLAHLSFEDLLVELLDRAREILDTDTAAILLFDEHGDAPGGHRRPRDRGGGAPRRAHPRRAGVSPGASPRRWRPVAIDRVDHTNVLNPILRDKGIRSLLGVPLISAGQVLGVLHVGTLRERQFTSEDADLLQLVGDRVALVTQASLTAVERSAAVALQRSIMPTRLPEIAGIELSARYVPGRGGRSRRRLVRRVPVAVGMALRRRRRRRRTGPARPLS